MSSAVQPQPQLQKTIAALGKVAQIWLDHSHPLRREAINVLQVSTGFTPFLIEQAIEAAFSELSLEKLLNFVASDIKPIQDRFVPTKVLHILAGNVFTAWLPGAAITLLLGSKCDLKPSTQEPVFALLWKRSMELADPLLADRVQVVRWQDDLLWHYPAVVAYGSDETMEMLKTKRNPETRFVDYGHKFSVGLLWKEALEPGALPETLAQIKKAAEPFDLNGCLSPQILYVEAPSAQLPDSIKNELRVFPKVKSFESWDALKEILISCRPHLSCIGVAGPAERWADIYSDMDFLGISRVCSLGEMQHPPLTWRNGGISLVDELTR